MKKYIFLWLSVSCFLPVTAQQSITLDEIWKGAFRIQSMDVLHSMKNGRQYTLLNVDRATRIASIDKYDYSTLQKVETILSSSTLGEMPPFSSYEFSQDESKILLATKTERLYRHSQRGKYYVYDILAKKTTPVSENSIQEPTFSPDGSKVAYAYQNNLYIKDLASGATRQVTSDGVKNKIINGLTDWVYEEEFSFVRAFQWNKTGSQLAFLKFNETKVAEFSMDMYGAELYPSQYTFKYPKAGMDNSEVSLHIYNLADGNTKTVRNLDAYYIPRIKWTSEPDVLSIQRMNRHQNTLDLIFYNSATDAATTVLSEQDKAYIDITDHLTFLEDNSFIWASEKDGNPHLYHYEKTGKLIRQLTQGSWDVTDFYGYDAKTKRIFYQATENGSVTRNIYAIALNGKKKQRLSQETGTHQAAFSADFSYYIDTFSNTTTPHRYTLHSAKDGALLREALNNQALSEKLKNYTLVPKEISTINLNGNELNMWMLKPPGFDPNKKYPLFLFQYSGPGSQEVANKWMSSNDYWYQMLAQQGYVVACVDGRGTGYKGASFKKMTYKELGKYETEDQIAFAKSLAALPYINKNRIGIWGWSYGGFISSNCILKGNDVFKMAIAVAPVTSWRFYDTIYTERYMQTPEENPDGYDANSPINHVEKLKGSYLLIHGSGDDNVHVQNTMRMIEALTQANKPFDWAIYPDKNHGIYGGNTRLHLYTKMTEFIKANL